MTARALLVSRRIENHRGWLSLLAACRWSAGESASSYLATKLLMAIPSGVVPVTGPLTPGRLRLIHSSFSGHAIAGDDPRTPHPPDPGGAGGRPASALLMARVQAPRAHRRIAVGWVPPIGWRARWRSSLGDEAPWRAARKAYGPSFVLGRTAAMPAQRLEYSRRTLHPIAGR
jgi:hypothetical protein